MLPNIQSSVEKSQPHPIKILSFIIGFLLVFGLAAGVSGAPMLGQAHTAPEAQAASGSIIGTVEAEPDGTKLENIRVTVFKNENNTWQRVGAQLTAADGTYDWSGLQPGTYHVYFFDVTGIYLDEFYLNTRFQEGAQDIEVTANSSQTIDAQLAPAGHITGRVYNEHNLFGIADVWVQAFAQIDGQWQPIFKDLTDVNGFYDLWRLRSENYRVKFYPENEDAFPIEWYYNAQNLQSAADIAVTAGELTNGIDAPIEFPAPENDDFDEAIEIASLPFSDSQDVSFATEANDDPILPCGPSNSSAYATVWYEFTPQENGLLTADTNGSDHWTTLAIWQGTRGSLSEVACDAYGWENDWLEGSSVSDVPLLGGTTYFIEIAANQLDDDEYPVGTAVLNLDYLPVSEGFGAISGRVTAEVGDQALSDIRACAYRYVDDDSRWDFTNKCDYTDVNGDYSIEDLTPDTYRIGFHDFAGVYAGEYYDDADSVEEATDVPFNGITVTGIDAALAVYGHITGRVTDETSGVPLEGIGVRSWFYTGTSWLYVSFDETDANGEYSLGEMVSNNYRVGFEDVSGNYAEEFYDNVADIDSADDIAVVLSSTTIGIDAELSQIQYGDVSGRVTDDNNEALEYINVRAYINNGSEWEPFGGNVDTDENGEYTLHLPVGVYRIKFSDWFEVWANEFYDDAPDVNSASDVVVTKDNETTGIDAVLPLIPPPENDDFDDAIEILNIPFNDNKDVRHSTEVDDDPMLPCGYNTSGVATIWYQFTPQENGLLTADTIGSFGDTILVIWKGSRGSLSAIACNDDIDPDDEWYVSKISDVPLEGGTTYYFEIASRTWSDDEYPVDSYELNVDFMTETGQIAGTVTDADGGAPLENIEVCAQTTIPVYLSDCDITDANGAYTIADLTIGDYHVKFSNVLIPPVTYGEKFYDQAWYLYEATPVTVSDGTTTSDIDAQLTASVVPVNDEIENAIEILTSPFSDSRDVLLAEPFGDIPDSWNCIEAETDPYFAPVHSVWYTITPGEDGLLSADTYHSGYDTILVVYQGSPGNLSSVACSDDHGWTLQSELKNVRLEAGNDYYIGVFSYDGSLGNLLLNAAFEPGIPIVNQDIQLHTGWNLISSYVEAQEQSMETLLSGIAGDMVLIKNGRGEIYWPAYGINQIGGWNVHDGYEIFMNNPAVLSISGYQAEPMLTPIPLPNYGWLQFAYLRDSSMTVTELGDTFMLVKNGYGQIYWPELGIDYPWLLEPGQGYKGFVSESDGYLIYPDNWEPEIESASVSRQPVTKQIEAD